MRKMILIIPLLATAVMLASSPAQMYRHATHIEQDSLPEAVALYRQASDSGYAPAQNYLGFMYYQGKGVRQDLDSALTLIEQAASANYPQACNNLAWLLLYGRDVQHDRHSAQYWLQRASDLGHAPSTVQLTEMLLQDQPMDSARVRDLAWRIGRGGLLRGGEILWQLDSALYDNMPADSLMRYAREYYNNGAPTPAIKLLNRLPDNDEAVLMLANATSRGYGVPYNYREALKLYLRAAQMGNQTAQDIIRETREMFPDALDSLTITNNE